MTSSYGTSLSRGVAAQKGRGCCPPGWFAKPTGQRQRLFGDHHHPDGTHPERRRERLWNMTTAQFPLSLSRTAEEDGQGGGFHSGVTRIGKWMFTPRSTDCGETQDATLGHEGGEIDLRYSSSIFEDFLHTMSLIQVEFGSRSGKTAPFATAVGECSGGSARV
ncbi:hypothetical protein ACFWTC_38175 [Streptomyces sp. NPDC058619]|uniref:hypothetical protein n=1 Tax=Streptomyces sp. NPDC058619 TaxID=3346559 RepID=UPI003662D2AE